MSRRTTIGSWVRRTGFWSLDRLKGGPIRRHYEDIRAAMEGDGPDPAALPALLEHATLTTGAYAPYAGCALADFPVLDRASLKLAPERFRSSRFPDAGLHVRRTSGSTGSPLNVAQDPEKRRRVIAETIYFNEMAGQRVGDRLLWMYAASLIREPRSRRFLQNVIAVDHVGLDEDRMRAVVRLLRSERINAILSISSTLSALARFLERTQQAGSGFGLRVIISTGETLERTTRDHIEAALGCPVVDRYSNEENGVLACTRPGEDVFLLDRASYHTELLELDTDEPETRGGLGRVIVTDLHNLATPLIRYDTGDLAIGVSSVDDGLVALRSIEGRRADVIRTCTGGQLAAPSVSGLMVRRFPDVERYQLVQVGPASYRLAIVPGTSVYPRDAYVEALRSLLGETAEVTVELVTSIAAGGRGKHRAVYSEWPPGDAAGRS